MLHLLLVSPTHPHLSHNFVAFTYSASTHFFFFLFSLTYSLPLLYFSRALLLMFKSLLITGLTNLLSLILSLLLCLEQHSFFLSLLLLIHQVHLQSLCPLFDIPYRHKGFDLDLTTVSAMCHLALLRNFSGLRLARH